MELNNCKNLEVQKLLSVLMFTVGIGLLIFMIIVEDELGAIPLVLIIFSAGWYFLTRAKIRSFSNNSRP